MPQHLIQEGSSELEPFRESVLRKSTYYIFNRITEIDLTAFFVNLFLLGFDAVSVSGGGSSPASPSCRTSRSLVPVTCGPEGGCDSESEEGAEGSRVGVTMRRFSAVKLPRRRELALTVTNREEEDEEDCVELEGTGRTGRNPGGRHCRLAFGGPVGVEFSRFDIGLYMVHKRDVHNQRMKKTRERYEME